VAGQGDQLGAAGVDLVEDMGGVSFPDGLPGRVGVAEQCLRDQRCPGRVDRCACGCGNKVVTPITPADWQLFYDGDAVSLTPSIGNWGFPCRSHYWIDAGRIRWAGAWTSKQISAGRARDDHERVLYFDRRAASRASWFRRLGRWLASRLPPRSRGD